MSEVKRDTACFSNQQQIAEWYVDLDVRGNARPMFSTQADAEAALRLGGIMAMEERDRLWAEINKVF